jgi:cytochrome c biogenesis protein CcmG/thiol:disulfide interchange protein DsbE
MMTETISNPEAAVAEPQARAGLGVGRILAVLGVLALVALLAAGLMRSSQTQPTAGTPPDFTLALFPGYDGGYGEAVTLSDLKGQVVIVNFWASWCIPCRDEAPLLEATWRRYRDQGIVLIGVGYNDTEPEALKYLAEFDITYPNGPDRRGVISQRYRVQGVPETFFVDRAGQIRHVEIGPLTAAKLQAALEPLLAR